MKTIEKPEAPTARTIAAGVAVSLILGLVNLVLLVGLVVPKLYGMDPLGLEQRLKPIRFNEVDNGSANQDSDQEPAKSFNSSLRIVAPAIESTSQTAIDPYSVSSMQWRLWSYRPGKAWVTG